MIIISAVIIVMTVVMVLANIIGFIACRFGDASTKECRPSMVLHTLVSIVKACGLWKLCYYYIIAILTISKHIRADASVVSSTELPPGLSFNTAILSH